MTAFIPSTTVTVLRGADGTDDWGYPTDQPTELEDGKNLPALLTPFTKRVYTPGSTSVTSIAMYNLRLRPGAPPLLESDRVRDDRSDVVYQVQEINQPPDTARAADQRVVLKRVS